MPSKPKYVCALVQMSCSESADANLQKAVALVEDAARNGAEVVCLPELFRSQYFCQREDAQLFDLAETVPGPTTEVLGKVAEARGVVIIAPIFERRAAGVYHNSAAVIDANGEVVGLYRKMHIPDDPAYYEKFYFTPGDLGFRAFDTRVGRVATLICWDQWYPEGARLAALQGPEHSFLPNGHRLAPCGEDPVRCRRNATLGELSSAGTPSPTVCTSPRSIAWGLRRPPQRVPDWSSGVRHLSATPSAWCWRRPRPRVRKPLSRRSTWRASKTYGATGPSFAIVVLILMRPSPADFWTRIRGESNRGWGFGAGS